MAPIRLDAPHDFPAVDGEFLRIENRAFSIALFHPNGLKIGTVSRPGDDEI
jgi:hypothetical protein